MMRLTIFFTTFSSSRARKVKQVARAGRLIVVMVVKKTSKSIMTSWRPLFYKATTEVFALTELLGKQLPNVDTWVNLDSLKDRSF